MRLNQEDLAIFIHKPFKTVVNLIELIRTPSSCDSKPQANLSLIVCATSANCVVDLGLTTTIAQFKTPMLRDLEDSAPYFHNGSKANFDDAVKFYINSAQLARQGKLRNGAVEFAGMSISLADLDALVAFLKSLTEDYDDA